MDITIIITFCVLLLIAYIFDLTSSKSKIPTVLLLLVLGWLVHELTNLIDITIPDFNPVLPVLGTIGLVLIVLEGSLELELNSSKTGIIRKSFIGASLHLFFLAFSLAFVFNYFGDYSFKTSLTNAIPFCVVSSAIAIPTVRYLKSSNKEFIIYESSLSDIMGVLFFNFITLNNNFDLKSFGMFGVQLLSITIISLVSIAVISFLLNRIEHHIKFVPIILLIMLIYAVTEKFHLPALIFILLFGLVLVNIELLKRFKWIEIFRPDELGQEVQRFKELVVEGTFLVRSLFFLLFGYLIETADVINVSTLKWSVGISFFIYVFRAVQLKISGLPMIPLLFIAPRGLITILLFLSITESQRILQIDRSLIIQVIVITAVMMTVGLMMDKKNRPITLPVTLKKTLAVKKRAHK